MVSFASKVELLLQEHGPEESIGVQSDSVQSWFEYKALCHSDDVQESTAMFVFIFWHKHAAAILFFFKFKII